MDNVIFVSWQEHRRTSEICAHFGITLHTLISRVGGIRRYLNLIPRTAMLLSRNRGKTVIVQNPSIVLSVLTVLLRRVFSLRVFIDAHNEAVTPYLNPAGWMRATTRWLHKHADMTIVTNEHLVKVVVGNGGRALVLPDLIPKAPLPLVSKSLGAGAFNVVFISTFAKDEPLADVLAAAKQLGPEFRFYVTGNDKKLPGTIRETAPANVSFTGFLDDGSYWSLLAAADLAIDLTLIDNCLVCGAYEALAVGTPMLLSDNAASKELFDGVALFANNSAASIASKVAEARNVAQQLRQSMDVSRQRFEQMWSAASRTFLAATQVNIV